MIHRIKSWLHKDQALNIEQFAHAHRGFLVIVCDPKDDTMFMAYRDKIVSGRIKSMDGFDHRVVKNVLKVSTFEREIDRLIGAVIDMLSIRADRCTECKQVIHPLSKWVNSFYSFIDGGLFNITAALRKQK